MNTPLWPAASPPAPWKTLQEMVAQGIVPSNGQLLALLQQIGAVTSATMIQTGEGLTGGPLPGSAELRLADVPAKHVLANMSDIAAPPVPTPADNLGWVRSEREVSSGAGLEGGGDLSANRTIALRQLNPSGTGPRPTVDLFGRVTALSPLETSDLSEALGASPQVTLPNIEALRLYDGGATTAFLPALLTPEDGAGGSYDILVGDTGPDDGVFTIVDILGRRWKRVQSDSTQVMIVGSIPNDPSKALHNRLMWQAAFDQIPAGSQGFVALSTKGTHYLTGTVTQTGGRAITLLLVGDVSYSGSSPVVSGLKQLRTRGPREAYFGLVDPQYENVGPVLETSSYGTNTGVYGFRHNHRVDATIVPRPGGAFTADIARSTQGVWAALDGTNVFGHWDAFVSPKTATPNGYGFAGYEINVENRTADYGYAKDRQSGNPWHTIVQLVPETQDFTSDGSTGYNILASLFFGQSQENGAAGYPARTYNAILSEKNAIAPAGRAIRFAGGDEASGLNRDPYAGVQLTDNWTTGLDFRLATFRGQDGLGQGHAARFGNLQCLAWQRSTGSSLRPIIGVNFDNAFVAAALYSAGILFSTESAAATMGLVKATTNTPNSYLQMLATTDAGAELSTQGAPTDIDLLIKPKGAGVVSFGNWTTSSDVAVNGYVTIKDAAGNTRKLATIA